MSILSNQDKFENFQIIFWGVLIFITIIIIGVFGTYRDNSIPIKEEWHGYTNEELLLQYDELCGRFTDPRDQQNYKWIRTRDGKIWMGENLAYRTNAASFCYQNNNLQDTCKKYGRYYTWHAAKEACPEGWHLPSRKEWEQLMSAYGGYWLKIYATRDHPHGSYTFDTLQQSGKARISYQTIRNDNSCNRLLSTHTGLKGKKGKFSTSFKQSFFWSATPSENNYDRSFALRLAPKRSYRDRQPGVKVTTMGKSVGLPCRCVKDDLKAIFN